MKTRYFISAALLALTTVGCTDLDVDIKSQYTEYPDSEIALSARINNAYYAFRGALGRRYDELISCNSDEYTAVSFDGDYLNGRDMSNISLHMVDADASNSQLAVFNDIQAGIVNCNQLLMDLGEEEENVSITAPIRAARAFYTFLLMDNWGDTPIIDYKVLDNSNAAIDRSPRADVARWIESELLAVRDNCPSDVSEDTYGTPTCWMVDALLAKLYINWNVYTKDVTSASWDANAANEKLTDCIAACDRIIESGKFDLSDDYKDKFMYTNGSQIKDFIYAMPYDAVTAQGMTYARFRTWRRGQNSNGFYSIEMTNSVGGNMTLTPEFVELFCLPGDRRNDVIAGSTGENIGMATFDVYQYDNTTGMPTNVRNTYKDEDITFTKSITLKNDPTANPPIVPNADLNCGADITGWTQGYRSIKFFPDINDYNVYSRNQDNDVPIFRYADVILMKCEAITRGGSATLGDTPMSLFNEIRAYVNAPLIESNPSLQDILDERGREFLDEHWRRNDLIRFGDFERDWGFKNDFNSNASNPQYRLLPLARDVLNANTNWEQNPGY
ncbi:RagB/SusD family nutrient uptake outer membrane protein [Caecibacteroides pullorum]|uniref:RagB/SusD family nutrient uptake outer membrane protein n=1 Tax=Caecibacteroides pullorum TaxID=2725562 RepID=A0AA41DAG3_9BACT|nr:RagB/SusD family nutrient uptake outer membrane protein [Caecibacteroides pullorum]MBM6857282.1 RagB/SusD family nutrient uptake outer membrane protein [Caecibacteroides pullorum]MBV8058400.1 RagB/SusD family nutrient uptake outer membrane protein [Caecibacteroides pullorum]